VTLNSLDLKIYIKIEIKGQYLEAKSSMVSSERFQISAPFEQE
jgi:hypothetical protein